MSGVAVESARTPTLRNRLYNPEEASARWTCTKRDGRKVPFDTAKIRAALNKCFANVPPAPAATDHGELISRIIRSVVNNLAVRELTAPDVEDVQRLVIAQLWTEGLEDAASHYQDYRDSRRKARESRPIPPELVAQLDAEGKHFPSDLQRYQHVSKFARWREEDGRRETWRETCTRTMSWLRTLPVTLDDAEWAMLDEAMYVMDASPAMRVVQMAGPALERCHVGAYNCAYQPISDLFSFAELLYILMQGTGEGFSVEAEYVNELPRVRKQKDPGVVHEFVVEDDTEGWCDALYFGVQKWFAGEDVVFRFHNIRKKGARLKTKGGRASGPEPLAELLTFVRKTILNRQGRWLSDLDVHDICCMIGNIVQVGGVRRAALISLSDLTSHEMRHAKSGKWYESAVYRSMANNSAVYEERPPIDVFMEEWLALMRSGSGERGIFNRQAAQRCCPPRRKRMRFGGNPCLEIILRAFQFCNLSIVIARPWDTVESLLRKVEIAAYFGTIQATATRFRYIRDDWRKNCEEERLIGVDITGQADCPLLQFGAPGRAALLRRLKAKVAEVNERLSTRFRINRAAADTCVKPGGDSAVLFDSSSGVSTRYAAHYWRWVRESVGSPVSQFLKDSGVPWSVAPENPNLLVFGFPKQSPEGSTLRNDLTAAEQFYNWLEVKENWAEHSVSVTIYVEPHEWLELGTLVYKHFDQITGLSFMPKDNGVYKYAPHEEMTAEQYAEACAAFPRLNWSKLYQYELEDATDITHAYACVGDSCTRV